MVLGPVGGGGRVEYGATGDALNTAARLQSHASPGSVLVGGVTRRAAGDLFAWSEERRLELKGKAEPVSAFEVVGERRSVRRSRRSAPWSGGSASSSAHRMIAERALAGEGGLLVITGDPGIGKSRLLEELRGHVSGSAVTWLEGRCVSFGGSTPYLPLRDPIVDALQLPRGEPVPTSTWPSRRGRSSPVIWMTPSRTCRQCSARSATRDAHPDAGDPAVARARRTPPVRPGAGPTRSGRDRDRGPPLGRRVHPPRAPASPPGGSRHLAPVRPDDPGRPRRGRLPDRYRLRTRPR